MRSSAHRPHPRGSDRPRPSSARISELTRHAITITFVSGGILLFEVAVTRIFSVLMFYHFAFMAVSLAMLGLGASSLLVFRFRNWIGAGTIHRFIGGGCLLAAIGIVAALAVMVRVPIALNYSADNVIRLLTIYAMVLIPFLGAGLAVSLILFERSKDVSRLYFFDLCGAAAGALLTVPLLNSVGAPNACLIAGLMFAAGGIIAFNRPKYRVASGLVLAGVALLLVFSSATHVFGLRYMKGRERGEIVFDKWNALSYVTVQRHPNQPDAATMEIDADAATHILRDPFTQFGVDGVRDAIATTWASSIPNEFSDSGRVLIIGPGGGMDVVFALAWGAKQIDAVELNPIIAKDVMRGRFREFSGRLYDRPEVNLVVEEGRSFVRRTEKKYDLIQLTLVDTWAASSAGAFSLAENHLYTVEAFQDFIRHLEPNGVLAVTRWISAKPRETLRLMTTAYEAATREGVEDPESHIAVAAVPLAGGSLELAAFMFRKSAFTPADIERIHRRLEVGKGRLVHSPFVHGDAALDQFAAALNKAEFISSYDYNILPATDDRPFFFNLLRVGQLRSLLGIETDLRRNNLGVVNLGVVALVSIVMVMIFFAGPVATMKRARGLAREAGAMRLLWYFILVGLGFILIEVALMQRYVLYLGHPVYALAVVLTSLLISAGLGALYTKHHKPEQWKRHIARVFGLMALMILCERFFTNALFGWTMGFPMGARLAISVMALAPLGFLMGQPFPMGLKRVDATCHELIPWAWGLNGAASVLGSVAAIGIAMAYGYSTVLLVAGACYGAAWGCLALDRKPAVGLPMVPEAR